MPSVDQSVVFHKHCFGKLMLTALISMLNVDLATCGGRAAANLACTVCLPQFNCAAAVPSLNPLYGCSKQLIAACQVQMQSENECILLN